ncbi:MAG: hypothetical protein AAFX45_13825 [Pseudomonadota bacterium]
MMGAASHGDLITVARLLRSKPLQMRSWVLARVFDEARAASQWVSKTNTCHPVWGDGTLMSAALRRGQPPHYGLDDPEYGACLAEVAREIGRPD